MTSSLKVARHRSAAKAATPISDITDTFVSGAFARKGVAVASATGIALTATVVGSAFANPARNPVQPTAKANDFVANLEADDTVTLVSLDVDWNPGDEVAAVAAEPEAVVEEAAPVEETQTADRDYDRSTEEAAEYSAAPAASMGSVVADALAYVGSPYVYAGDSPSGFDCSGFTQYIYGMHGVSLPHSSSAQAGYGTAIPASEAQAGDLVVWSYGHVAIYLGDGQIVHAATESTGVTTGSLFGDYYFVRL